MAKQKKLKDKVKASSEVAGKQIIDNLRAGHSLSLDFFKRHGWMLALVIVIAISFMGLKYKTKTHMSEINALNKELSAAESKKIYEKQQYMTLIRQTRMNELVRENNLGLVHQEQPPYEIVDENPVKQ